MMTDAQADIMVTRSNSWPNKTRSQWPGRQKHPQQHSFQCLLLFPKTTERALGCLQLISASQRKRVANVHSERNRQGPAPARLQRFTMGTWGAWGSGRNTGQSGNTWCTTSAKVAMLWRSMKYLNRPKWYSDSQKLVLFQTKSISFIGTPLVCCWSYTMTIMGCKHLGQRTSFVLCSIHAGAYTWSKIDHASYCENNQET